MRGEHYKKLNDKLLVKNQCIKTIVNNVDTGILTIGPKNYIKVINDTAGQILGLTQEDVLGLKIGDIIEQWETIEQEIDSEQKISYSWDDIPIKGKICTVYCTLRVYPIVESGMFKYDRIICTINETKNSGNLTDKVKKRKTNYTFDKIIGKNNEFTKLINYAKQISDSLSTVLITGESGTGKEMFAQSIHNESSRREAPFVAINCGALPETLIESELFGYEEGAFTGALKGGRAGKFELADGGTLFLDEIGEMPIEMQTNLLRVLESGRLFRVGGSKVIKVDVRIIAATNKDLLKEIKNKKFRKDLYYRLNVLPLHLPPLRQRRDDIPLLIDHFIKIKSEELGRSPILLSSKLMKEMVDRPWPGNIRELENNVERIVNAQNSSSWYEPEADEAGIDEGGTRDNDEIVITADKSLDAVEREHIKKIIKKCDGNITTSAEVLGIARNTLYRKIKKYNIEGTTMN